MATVGTLVSTAGQQNRLRYLVTFTDATTLVITSTGAASPDLLTDTLSNCPKGPLRDLALVFTRGYGTIAAGAITQAQARNLWANDATANTPGNFNLPRAQCSIVGRVSATGLQPSVEVNVDGAGKTTIIVTPPGAAGSCYLDIEVAGAIGA